MAFKRSHLSPRTRAYTKAGSITAEVVIGSDPDMNDKAPPSEHDYGWKPVWVKLMVGTNRPVWLSLTNMTHEELLAFKRLMDLGFEAALEIAADLDKQAEAMLLREDLQDVPIRALASPPPWYEREIPLAYDGPSGVHAYDE
jgi:hypothetical protein